MPVNKASAPINLNDKKIKTKKKTAAKKASLPKTSDNVKKEKTPNGIKKESKQP